MRGKDPLGLGGVQQAVLEAVLLGHLGFGVLLVERRVEGHRAVVLLRRLVFLAGLRQRYPGRKPYLSSLVEGASLFLGIGFSFLGV